MSALSQFTALAPSLTGAQSQSARSAEQILTSRAASATLEKAAGATFAAPAEASRTSRPIPPVMPSRETNATAVARDGGEGRAAPERPEHTEEVEDALASDRARDAARRTAEATRRQIAEKELLANIPVPVDVIPKLGVEVAEVRTIGREADVRLDQSA